MRDACVMEKWDHTAAIMTKIHNVNITKAADAIRDPSTLNPIRVRLQMKNTPDPTPEELGGILSGLATAMADSLG